MTNQTAGRQWKDLFRPVVEAGSISGQAVAERPQQAQLGEAISRALTERTALIAEAPTGTGKSAGALIPVIDEVHQAAAAKKAFRAVVSTETNSLQDQYINKDLPYLHQIYGNFSFSILKGRRHYLCLDHARQNSRGNQALIPIVSALERVLGSLGDGERGDIEKRVGKLGDEQWSMLAGDKFFCNDNQCDTEGCFTARARAKALASDIVIVTTRFFR